MTITSKKSQLRYTQLRYNFHHFQRGCENAMGLKLSYFNDLLYYINILVLHAYFILYNAYVKAGFAVIVFSLRHCLQLSTPLPWSQACHACLFVIISLNFINM